MIKGVVAEVTKQRVFSGIQPSGIPHLGNYFGALTQWISISNQRKVVVSSEPHKVIDCDTPIFSIVDNHAWPTETSPRQLYGSVLTTTASLLALGLDPQKCILFRQFDIPEHGNLGFVLNKYLNHQRLLLMTQFKDKSKTTAKMSINNGLVQYPVLQAADILLYRASLVPVGEDQIQHIELTRDIAKKFNAITESQLFPLPQAILPDSDHARRIKSLRQPDKKMSKSDKDSGAYIQITDEPDVILQKVKKAVTDCLPEIKYDADQRPAISNLMRIYHLATGDSFECISKDCYGMGKEQFKLRLAEILIEKFSDTRREFKRLKEDPDHLKAVLKFGADKARPIVEETTSQLRQIVGER